jgi:hypothetical protein
MMFETVRWGVPNMATIVALAFVPLISMAMPGQKTISPVQFVSVEQSAEVLVDIQIALVQTQEAAP